MDSTRRGFLSKLGIGSIIMGTAGIFELKKEIILPEEIKQEEVKIYNEFDLIKIANEMFDAMDGRVQSGQIYNFVQSQLKRRV